MSTEFTVYVYVDADGAPLYVGQTSDLTSRDETHRRFSDWRPSAHCCDVLSTHPTRSEAVTAEFLAIQRLRPQHNVMGNGSTPSVLGTAIRTMRLAQGLTLHQLAARADINAGYLSQVERGERTPDPRWQAAVTDALADHLAGAA